MTFKERQAVFDHAQERRMSLMVNKGKEYSKGSTDALYNFKEVAQRLGLTPNQTLLVYLEKAMFSVEKWVKDGQLSSGETIISRLDDVRNYCDLLEALINDK